MLRTLNRMNDLVPGAHVEGDVHYRGASLYAKDVSPIAVRRRIGMVFQKPNPFPKSIYDNVAYGPRINGERNKGKLNEIVERSLRRAALWDEVKDRLNKSGLGLSGGQAQRLCIARTLAVEPDVVLMDEPCSALDPIATGAIEDLMREIKSEYTIVIVTHNMQQATRVSDRTAFYSVLRNEKSDTRTGVLVEYDRTEQHLPEPARQPHPGLRDRPDGLSSDAPEAQRPPGIITTGHVAWCVTWLLTEPMRSRANPPLPRDPTTSMSASREALTSSSAASPVATLTVISGPVSAISLLA